MAKSSINIKGDSSLISAATRASMANVPIDQRQMWQTWSSGFEQTMKDVTEGFIAYGKARQEKIDNVLGSLDELETMAKDGALPEDSEAQMLFQKEYEDIKQEIAALNPYGGKSVDKARELNNKADNLIKARTSEQQYSTNIISAIKNDGVLKTVDSSVYDKALAISEHIKGNDVEGFEKQWTGSKFQYSLNGKKFELKDIQSGLRLKNTEALKNVRDIILKTQQDSEEQANNPKVNYDTVKQNLVGKLTLEMENAGAFETIISEKVGFNNEKSYLEALHTPGTKQSATLFNTLFRLDPSKDSNKDGKVDQQDFGTTANYNAFVKTITDPNDKNFDKELAYNLAASYIAETEGKESFDMGQLLGFKQPKASKTGGGKADNTLKEQLETSKKAMDASASQIPLPAKIYGTGVVATKKEDGKYYISSGAKSSARLDPEEPGKGFTLSELADVLGVEFNAQTSGFLPVEGGPFSRTFNVNDLTPKVNNEFSE